MHTHHKLLPALTLALLATACTSSPASVGSAPGTTSSQPSTAGAHQTTAGTSPEASPAGSSDRNDVVMASATVSKGKVTASSRRVDVPLGKTVEIVVKSDVADHVHVHGYDDTVEVKPGQVARLRVNATVPGVFEVELEESGLLLFELRVR